MGFEQEEQTIFNCLRCRHKTRGTASHLIDRCQFFLFEASVKRGECVLTSVVIDKYGIEFEGFYQFVPIRTWLGDGMCV
jgi:hypothetical protein